MKKHLSLLLLFVMITFSACGTKQDVITFGTGTIDDGIEKEKSSFKQGEDFLLEVYLSDSFGTSEIKYNLLILENDHEIIYAEWTDSVDPTWNYIIYEFHIVDLDGEFEPGEYIVRMFTDESELIAEGTFTIE